MPDWVLATLAVMSVPLAAILGGVAVIGFIVWVIHKNRMVRLEVEEKQRQAELDRELLGLGSKDIAANLEVILDRLGAVETRLDKVESMQNIEIAKGRGHVPISPQETEEARRDRPEQTERA